MSDPHFDHCDLGDGRDKRIKERLPNTHSWALSDNVKAGLIGFVLFIILALMFVSDSFAKVLIVALLFAMVAGALFVLGQCILEIYRAYKDVR